jgi:ABC-type glycerol-3-phosphate transport system permease component
MGGLVFVWATPVIVAIDIWQWMFDFEFGIVNYVLTQIHAGNFIHHNWFDNPVQGLAVLVLVVVWGAIPFVTITLFAGLLQVPNDVIDAAQVDGASGWHTFWFVTAPMLKPIFLIVICLSTIWDFRSSTRSTCCSTEAQLGLLPDRGLFVSGIVRRDAVRPRRGDRGGHGPHPRRRDVLLRAPDSADRGDLG